MFNTDMTLDEIADAIEAEGYDSGLVLALYDLLAESAAEGVRSKLEGEMALAAILFGRVTAIFDVLAILGIPAPAADPNEIMVAAEAILAAESGEDA